MSLLIGGKRYVVQLNVELPPGVNGDQTIQRLIAAVSVQLPFVSMVKSITVGEANEPQFSGEGP